MESNSDYFNLRDTKRKGGFGDISSEEETETTVFTSPFQYSNLSRQDWSYLLSFDLESCCLSFVMPYHVIAKIGKRVSYYYTAVFITYAFFFATFNYTYAIFAHSIKPVCNKSHYTDWCFLIYDQNTCEKSYSEMSNDNVLCSYNTHYHTCYATDEECILHDDFVLSWCAWGFLELISISVLTTLHVYFRRQLRRQQKLPLQSKWKDICLSLWCTTCSLAQQFRALTPKTPTIQDEVRSQDDVSSQDGVRSQDRVSSLDGVGPNDQTPPSQHSAIIQEPVMSIDV